MRVGVLGMVAGVVMQRRVVAQDERPSHRRIPYPAHESADPARRRTSPSWAPVAAGLYAALTAAADGRARRARERDPARAHRQLLGAGRPRRGARVGRLARAAPATTREIAGRGARAPVGCRRPVPRGAADRRRPRAARRALRRSTADGALALGLEGGHSRRRVVHAGGSATGRRVVRQLSALVAEHPRIDVLEQARAATVWRRDGRCVGLVCEDGRAIAAARRRARDRRRRGAVVAHDEPAGLDRDRRCCSRTPPARRSPTSS